MKKLAVLTLVAFQLTGCGLAAAPGQVQGPAAFEALAGKKTPASALDAFEKLVEKHVKYYNASNAEHREAMLDAAGFKADGKPGFEPVTLDKIDVIERYVDAIEAANLKDVEISLSLISQLKGHADYVFHKNSIYPQRGAAHLRIFKAYMALVKRYEVRQPAAAIARFMGIAHGAKNGGQEAGVKVMEDYLEALDKAGFNVRGADFAAMNFSGRGGFPSMLSTMSFERKKGITQNVGPAFARKALPDVLAALKGKEKTANSDDVCNTLEGLMK